MVVVMKIFSTELIYAADRRSMPKLYCCAVRVIAWNSKLSLVTVCNVANLMLKNGQAWG